MLAPKADTLSRPVQFLSGLLAVLAAITLVHVAGLSMAEAAAPSFVSKTILTPATPGASLFDNPTTLAFGPDGRLYVGQQDGRIHALTLDAARNVTAVERFDTIYNTPNKNDDGTPAPGVNGRTLLGIVFDPASPPSAPVLYVTHSDPRIGFNNSTTALAIDTHSGTLTKLTGPNFDNPANRQDLITGLPRSRENHGPNGLAWGPDGWLYLAQGGNTNNGAPSTFFSNLPEYYLSAAVLRAHVKSPTFTPIDVSGVTTAAHMTPFVGKFELYGTGYRNPMDLVWHSNGKLYLNDNGGNDGFGGTPGPADGCPGAQAVSPPFQDDRFFLVEQGKYGGHPNPARGECVFTDGTIYDPDLPPDPNYQAHLIPYYYGNSTNGIVEYTADVFDGEMKGDLISATWGGDQNLRRVKLLPDGTTNLSLVSKLGEFNQPLDVTTDDDGVLYVAEHGGDAVVALLPNLPGEWSTKANLLNPVQEVSNVAADNGKIYVPGGLTTGFARLNKVQVYDIASDSWSYLPHDYPHNADHIGAAVVDGTLYAFGGLLGYPVPPLTYTYAYDPLNGWIPKADMPEARSGMGVAVLDGKIYASGGLAGFDAGSIQAVNNLWRYDPVANTWEVLAPMPTARDSHNLEAFGGKLYAIGGRNSGDFGLGTFTAVEVYDPATNTWTTGLAPLPTARAATGSAVLGGEILIFGGEGWNGFDNAVFNENEAYNPLTNTWRKLEPLPLPVHGNGGAVFNNVVYMPSGGTQPFAGAQTNKLQVFTLSSGTCSPGGPGDSDGDGYSDDDEIANFTDACSAASKPEDFDKDFISDLNDPDDDNDGILDVNDKFFFDAANGIGTVLPLYYGWNPGDPVRGHVANTGFTGVQISSNNPNYVQKQHISVGAAGGYLAIFAGEGTNEGPTNTQANALQIGFNATKPFQVHTRITQPFIGKTPAGKQAAGLFLGPDEDNYVKLVVTADKGDGAPGIQFASESGGSFNPDPTSANPGLALPGPSDIDLFLEGNPAGGTISAFYRVNSTNPADVIWIGTVPVAPSFFVNGSPVGVLTSRAGTPNTITFGFDYFEIRHLNQQQSALVRINAGGPNVTTPEGIAWNEDDSPQYYSFPGTGHYVTPDPNAEIAGTDADAIYRSERFLTEGSSFTYTIPLVNPDTYTVRLHFAEIYWSAPAKRVFSVDFENGLPALINYDIYADVGAMTAAVKEFTVPVNDGALDIHFIKGPADNPKISAIEVLRSDAQASPSIAIAKTAQGQLLLPGSTITFTISVTNTGDTTLQNVEVLDEPAPVCSRSLGNLTAGAALRYDCAVVGVTDSFTNTAVVTGTPLIGTTVIATDTVTVNTAANVYYLPLVFKNSP